MPGVTVTQSDAGKTISVGRGDTVEIRLAETPPTGYRWGVDSLDQNVVQLQRSDYAVAPDSGVGGGGERRLTLVARQAGTTRLQLKLWREWEGDSSVTQRFDVTIEVHG